VCPIKVDEGEAHKGRENLVSQGYNREREKRVKSGGKRKRDV